MNPTPKTLGLLLALLLACPALAAVPPKRWTVETSEDLRINVTAYRGETVPLAATLLTYGRPVAIPAGATATFHWQTPGMEELWWSAPATATSNGTLLAAWTPAMDTGADRYTFFIGLDDDAGLNYRANGLIILRHAPGAVPNELALPAKTIDFDLVTVLNPPWATQGDIDAAIDNIPPTDLTGYVPATRQINNKPLTGDIAITYQDVGAAQSDDGDILGYRLILDGGVIMGKTWITPNTITLGGGGKMWSGLKMDEDGIRAFDGAWALHWPVSNTEYVDDVTIATSHDISMATVDMLTDEQDPLSIHRSGGTMTGQLRGPKGTYTDSYVTLSQLNAVAPNYTWLNRSGLSGAVAFVNTAGRPQRWSGTGVLTVTAFEGLTTPAPVYWVLHGFDSVTLPADIYFVGGGTWQVGRANHFLVWQVGTQQFINFVTASEIE